MLHFIHGEAGLQQMWYSDNSLTAFMNVKLILFSDEVIEAEFNEHVLIDVIDVVDVIQVWYSVHFPKFPLVQIPPANSLVCNLIPKLCT
jgi:hypothetical protein